MNIHIIYFTKEAEKLAFSLRTALEETSDSLTIASGGQGNALPYIPVALWTTGHFRTGEALVYIGAAGIAVRSIAKHVKDKTTDPAVLVVDERGQFAVPILSGHVGEANRLAKKIAAATGGTAVLTTASDVRGLFAADVFAKDNGLQISDREAAKRFAAVLLDHGAATLVIPGEMSDMVRIDGELPGELTLAGSIPAADTNAVCMITPFEKSDGCLRLIPKNLILGVGCRRGIEGKELRSFAAEVLAQYHLSAKALARVASIDRKKDEAGIRELAQAYDIPFDTFDSETLCRQMMEDGAFTASAFVEDVTGVDNVCERAAVAAGAKRLLVKKTARGGMTIALGLAETVLRFDTGAES